MVSVNGKDYPIYIYMMLNNGVNGKIIYKWAIFLVNDFKWPGWWF